VLQSEGNINALRTLAPPPLRPRSQAVTPPARTPPAGAAGSSYPSGQIVGTAPVFRKRSRHRASSMSMQAS
jgi:hypothetical protein